MRKYIQKKQETKKQTLIRNQYYNNIVKSYTIIIHIQTLTNFGLQNSSKEKNLIYITRTGLLEFTTASSTFYWFILTKNNLHRLHYLKTKKLHSI